MCVYVQSSRVDSFFTIDVEKHSRLSHPVTLKQTVDIETFPTRKVGANCGNSWGPIQRVGGRARGQGS